MHWMQQAADQQIRASAAWQVSDWSQAGLGEPKNPALATQWWPSYRLGLVYQKQHQGKLVSECVGE